MLAATSNTDDEDTFLRNVTYLMTEFFNFGMNFPNVTIWVGQLVEGWYWVTLPSLSFS
jgi:hypothetical protein